MPTGRTSVNEKSSSRPLMIVTGTLPGEAGVGAIILRDLLKRFEERFCFIAGFSEEGEPAGQTARPPIGVKGVISRQFQFPCLRTRLGRGPSKWVALVASQIQAALAIRRCTREIVAEANQLNVGGVLVVLESAAAMSVGWRVAGALGVPLLAYVWDHGPQILRQAGLNRLLRRRFSADFSKSLKTACRGAVVSETMQSDYGKEFGLGCLILRHGVVGQASYVEDGPEADEGAHDRSDCPWTIGFAGTDYARSAWDCLMAALDHVGWNLAGRPVRVRVMGGMLRLSARGPRWIEFLGYRSPEEAVRLLKESDLNFLSHPFESDWFEFSRYSFPTKLSSYVAAGAPVLVFAPPYSSLETFAQDHPVGIHCNQLDSEELASRLSGFAESLSAQASAREAVAQVGGSLLSSERFFKTFCDFTAPASN